jgi:cyclophilin family peptidyl-prolyl cis-trans isomerase
MKHLLIVALVFSTSCSEQEKAVPVVDSTPDVPSGEPFAIVETDHGEITVRLRPDLAPQTVERFIELAEVGFYKRTTFHRVMRDRMIQGGDPNSRDRDPYNDGQGTSGEYLPQEFSSHPFDRGTVAMGRLPGGDNGGSCQFFIVLKESRDWDGQYNAFGEVVEGIEVADEISRVELSNDPHPSMKSRPVGKQIIKGIRIEYRE